MFIYDTSNGKPFTIKKNISFYVTHTLSYLQSIILKRKKKKRNIQDKSLRKKVESFTSFIKYNKFENFLSIFHGLEEREDVILLFMTKIFICTVWYKWCKNVVQNTWKPDEKEKLFCVILLYT